MILYAIVLYPVVLLRHCHVLLFDCSVMILCCNFISPMILLLCNVMRCDLFFWYVLHCYRSVMLCYDFSVKSPLFPLMFFLFFFLWFAILQLSYCFFVTVLLIWLFCCCSLILSFCSIVSQNTSATLSFSPTTHSTVALNATPSVHPTPHHSILHYSNLYSYCYSLCHCHCYCCCLNLTPYLIPPP